METRKEEIKKWWDSVEHVRHYTPEIRFLTIDEFIAHMENYTPSELTSLHTDEIVDIVFETVWQEMVKPVFEKDTIEVLPEERRNFNTFVRYMCGQLAIFSAFETPESSIYRDGILKFIKEKAKTKTMTIDEIENAETFFGAYVDLLAQKNMITYDDASTYKEIYPMFEPCYVFYDENKSYYDSLSNVYKRLFKIPHRIIIMGLPGCGKGTQSKLIAEKYGLVHISTGDLVREVISKQTELGKKCEAIINTGGLLPDELINPIFLDRILKEDCKTKGWILDGYPRTTSNLEFVRANRLNVTGVIFLTLDDDTAIERQCGRITDPLTGAIYHSKFLPPTEEIRERLVKRATDNEEKAKIRVKVYHDEMDQAFDWFPEEISHKIDATPSPEEVFEAIKKLL